MCEEVWKPIAGYDGYYDVSNLGNVRSLRKNGQIMKAARTSNGYYGLYLCLNGHASHYLVHRLVASTFIPNPNNLPQVNHIDENKANNSVDNLEWVAQRTNSRKSAESRYKKYGISKSSLYDFLRNACYERGISLTELCSISDVSKSNVSRLASCNQYALAFPTMYRLSKGLGISLDEIADACYGS